MNNQIKGITFGQGVTGSAQELIGLFFIKLKGQSQSDRGIFPKPIIRVGAYLRKMPA
ncbi:hypothetical protein DESME_09575 [Desulfitobacterium metallireducens DSM 15288]|uniref:Uncharacterized protein n=1 Tax=Desulfitobacterium metallireducens DSM 15288 TaxID=871968 RepID=W0ECK4_9FIRM|nr:hypothetical protein DESME_09575 [Desulfitobacterium metallireducens DSM 15288]